MLFGKNENNNRYEFYRVIYSYDPEKLREELNELKKIKINNSPKIAKKIKKRIFYLENELNMYSKLDIKTTEILFFDKKKNIYYKVDKNFKILLFFNLLSLYKKENIKKEIFEFFYYDIIDCFTDKKYDVLLEKLYSKYIKKEEKLNIGEFFVYNIYDENSLIRLSMFNIGNKEKLKILEKIINKKIKKFKKEKEIDLKRIKLKKFNKTGKKDLEFKKL